MEHNPWPLRLAIVLACLFSLNSLGTCMMVGLSNADWSAIKLQAKFVLCVGIFVNWSGTMMAFLSKAITNIELGKLPLINGGDTSMTSKPETTNTLMKTVIGLIGLGWLVILVSCASFSTNLFRAEQTVTQTAYDAYVTYTNLLANGTLTVTADQSNAVKQARIKLAASVLTVEQWRQAYQTNSAVKPQAQAALDALEENGSNVVALINLLKSK